MNGTPYTEELPVAPDQQLMPANTDPLSQAAAMLNAHAPEGERLAFVNPQEEQMLIDAGGSGVPAVGGVPSYKGEVAPTPPRDYYTETRDTLQAQVDLSPDLAAAEARTRPLYNALELADLNQMLRGTRSQPKGLLSLYEEDINPTLSRIEATDRSDRIAGEMDAINRYAAPVSQTLRESTGNAPLLDELNQQALSELQSGATLDPSLRREVQQAIRSGQASRGLGYGTRDLAAEALATGLQAEQLRRNRQGFAQSMVGINQATGGDPFMAILGRPSQAFAAAQGLGGQAYGMSQGIGNKMFNPESNYAGSLYSANQNAQLQSNLATAANKTAITGAIAGAAGSAIGGIGMGKCWVAREVYGINNPRWLLFREWMLKDAPVWFRTLYITFGERFAEWIKDKPILKRIVRRFMDDKVEKKFGVRHA